MKIPLLQHIANLSPYQPGKPIKEVERELGLKNTIKLASNENPLGPSPKAVKAAKMALKEINLYPEGGGFYLCEALSKHFKVPTDWIILGNGSVELIEIAAKAFIEKGLNSVMSEGSFAMYKIATLAMGGEAREVKMKERTHDLKEMAKAVDKNTRIVMVANPNNPTGTYNPYKEIKEFVESLPESVLVIIDEAYKEYITKKDYKSAQDLIDKHPNLLVLGTFSKAYGLAGLRIGYGFGNPELLKILHKVRSPFNTSLVAQEACIAALNDTAFVKKSVDLNTKEMAFVEKELKKLKLNFTPSVGNFILIDLPISGKEFFEKLLREGVIVRPMAMSGFPNSVRVTISTRKDNKRFIAATKKVLNL
ncbi:MAG: histidinol-phosphate transaminase [Thermoanaerobaculaceae bacterium]|nr:histidinol-phosphate transaminase [Thermoanaerobaculaceae bacterium]